MEGHGAPSQVLPRSEGGRGLHGGDAAGAPAADDTASRVAESRRLQVLGTGRRRAGLSEPMRFPDTARPAVLHSARPEPAPGVDVAAQKHHSRSASPRHCALLGGRDRTLSVLP